MKLQNSKIDLPKCFGPSLYTRKLGNKFVCGHIFPHETVAVEVQKSKAKSKITNFSMVPAYEGYSRENSQKIDKQR
jgi:hypothetical protein